MLKVEYNEFYLNLVLDIFLWNEGYKCLVYNILIVRNLKSLIEVYFERNCLWNMIKKN